ncbi:MAG TPA: trehalose-phosphatase [Candidatus Binataceae bacterium]|jgi:trehalose 6-phosphate phosphatase|nr:trehalose-phosphatase [Candidatus Binataceae bacterium]
MLEELARRAPLLLCLDYDGTIAEIVSRPALARPIAGVVDALRALARHPERVAPAIVSGRPIAELRRMTGLGDEVMFAGVHGLEIAGRDAVVRVPAEAAQCAVEIDRVRDFLRRNADPAAGFEVEDKRLSVALHYRNADPVAAAALCARLEQLVRAETPSLRAAHNKMVLEALPRAASKGAALRALSAAAGPAFVPVYFGDDRTDEDAFAELGERGVAVMVGQPRPTRAPWRVDAPADVARLVIGLAAALDRAAAGGSLA